MAGSRSTPSSSKMLSAENFARVLARIEELETQQTMHDSLESRLTVQFEARFAMQGEIIQQQTKTIQQQAIRMESLETKSLILQAKLNGLEDTFFLFPMLPAEIRRMIWEQALLPGRVVEVHMKQRQYHLVCGKVHQRPSKRGFPVDFPSIFDVARKGEVLLFACEESRLIAERTRQSCFVYEPSPEYTFFAMDSQPGDIPVSHDAIASSGVPFRPDLDIVFLRWGEKMEDCLTDALIYSAVNGIKPGNILSLAIDIRFIEVHIKSIWEYWFSSSSGCFPNQPMLPKLQRLIIVHGYESTEWKRGIRLRYVLCYTAEALRALVAKQFEKHPDIVAPIVEIITEKEIMTLL